MTVNNESLLKYIQDEPDFETRQLPDGSWDVWYKEQQVVYGKFRDTYHFCNPIIILFPDPEERDG